MSKQTPALEGNRDVLSKKMLLHLIIVIFIGLTVALLAFRQRPGDLEGRSWVEKNGIRYAVKALAWKGDQLEIEYSLTAVNRKDPGFVHFFRPWATATVHFWTEDGMRIKTQGQDLFFPDGSVEFGSRNVLFGVFQVPCDSQTIILRVTVPEGAAKVAVSLDALGPETRPVSLPRKKRQMKGNVKGDISNCERGERGHF